ncbi:hypothetical protein O181_024976 [Austropuccinia psidii MF-1]|uniref:Uncharacterized protein n=1 Tax=Austropuccinia psidii MF-1 TaxID=1389203 RepID=A0A9Q3GZ44_9BASI|nr:hypothetical protein [Austropuccinia psidii MF-1]
MCKTKPAKGKGYTSGETFIISILMNDVKAKVNLDKGQFCTCVHNDCLQCIVPKSKDNLLPIEDGQFRNSRNNMYPLDILDTDFVFPHHTGSLRMRKEIVLMETFTYQHIILGNDYLNTYGIEILNHEDRYFRIGGNERQKFASSNMSKQILVVFPNEDTYREEFVTYQLLEAHINLTLSSKMKHELIDVLYTYKNEFASENEPSGAISGNEDDITLNIDRPYPPVLRRPAYPESSRAKEALNTYQRAHTTWCTKKSRLEERI